MNEEKKLVLQMLEDGKITASEAEALLGALGETSELEDEDKQADIWSRIEKQGEDFADKVESAAERFYRSLETKTEGSLADKIADFPRMLSKIPFVSQEERHEFVMEYTGDFAEGLEKIPINIATGSGKIALQSWDQPGYCLTITQHIRSKDRESARQRMHDIGWADGEVRDAINIEVPSFHDISIGILLKVPYDLLYKCQLRTQNGSVNLNRLQVETLDLGTANGSVRIYNVQAEKISGQTNNGSAKIEQVDAEYLSFRTGNGSCKLTHVNADEIDCITGNGSIKVDSLPQTAPSKLRLRSTNGKIRVDGPIHPSSGVAFDLQSAVGRVNVHLDRVSFSQNARQGGGAHIVGQTEDFDAKANKLNIVAKTSSGSIVVGTMDN